MSTQYLFVASIMAALQELQINSAKLQVQTQIMDQSLAIMLRQLCYGKISFIVLLPGSAKKKNVLFLAQALHAFRCFVEYYVGVLKFIYSASSPPSSRSFLNLFTKSRRFYKILSLSKLAIWTRSDVQNPPK